MFLQKTTTSNAAKRDGVQLRQGINESDASEIVRRVSSEDTDKHSGDENAESKNVTDADTGKSKPHKADSPAIIHVQKNVEASQLQHTEINAIAELPKDVHLNETARDVVQDPSATEPSVEKLLTTSKPSASRSESDFEPPPCKCPGIYIFFLLVFLFKSMEVLFYFQPA